MKKTCKRCPNHFEVDDSIAKWCEFCPACSKALCAEADKVKEQRNVEARAEKWNKLCPAVFRDTVREKLPLPRRLDAVFSWAFGWRGMLLHGPTGTGKSRCAWLLAHREFMAGRSVLALSAISGIDYMGSFKEGAGYAAVWWDKFRRCDLLLMDDVFKASATEGYSAALFALVNERCEHKKPIIVTTNDDSKSLASRMSGKDDVPGDRALPLVRRLKEHCVDISFGK